MVIPKNENDNVIFGDVFTIISKRCLQRTEKRMLAALGLENIIIIETSDAVLAAHKNHVQNVKSIVEKLKADINKDVRPGASEHGNILFFKTYGLANIFTKEKVTKETIFDLASLTKPLATSLALMLLIQKKHLSLNQKLGTILNECNGTDKENILIKHLLCHNSGLPACRPKIVIMKNLLNKTIPL